MHKHILGGYCLGEDSDLIQARIKYQKHNLERAKQKIDHLQQMFLHTEQGLMLYLGSEEFAELLMEKAKDIEIDLFSNNGVLLVNIASSVGVCMNCGDRLFRESEQGNGFFRSLEKKIRNKLELDNLKLCFIASSSERFTDDLANSMKKQDHDYEENLEIRNHYLKMSPEIKKKFGFYSIYDKYKNSITFLHRPDLKYREEFNVNKPLLGHALLNGNY